MPTITEVRESLQSIQERLDSLMERFDRQGQGKPCGKGFISARKKCSKEKASQLASDLKAGDEGAKARVQRGKQLASDRARLKREVERDRGKKPEVIERKPRAGKVGDIISATVPGWGDVEGIISNVVTTFEGDEPERYSFKVTSATKTNKRSRTRYNPGETVHVLPNWVKEIKPSNGESKQSSTLTKQQKAGLKWNYQQFGGRNTKTPEEIARIASQSPAEYLSKHVIESDLKDFKENYKYRPDVNRWVHQTTGQSLKGAKAREMKNYLAAKRAHEEVFGKAAKTDHADSLTLPRYKEPVSIVS